MNRTAANAFHAVVTLAITVGSYSSVLEAQTQTAASLSQEVFPGSVADNYLRYLQSVGRVPVNQWTSRPFSSREMRRLLPADSAHPWQRRFENAAKEPGKVEFGLIQPSVSVRYNSSFAYGFNDGPIWAGRGVTSAVQAGFFAGWGPVSLVVAPMAFRASNQEFEIIPKGTSGYEGFGNPQFGGVDRPERFGDAAYGQVDPGQTTLRVDLPFFSIGASTGNQQWGPGQELPIILGNNAAGFPHIFAGTSEPVDLYIAKLHAKVMWGELRQSDYSSVTGPEHYVSRAEPGTKRFTTGIVFSVQPRGLSGLEIGGTRFFHSIWPRSGIPRSYVTKVFEGILKKDLPPNVIQDPRFPPDESLGIADNQLASVFARWVLPRSGFEMSFEYGREDHSYDFRDLLQEPDHARAYTLGARKVFSFTPKRMTAARVEIMNFQLPQLARYREEGEMYVHGLIRQGHTYKGQLLGADVGVGTGAGSVTAVDQYSPKGRWTASWTRIVRQENGNYTLLGVRAPRSIDVSHALGYEAARFYQQYELTYGVTVVRELNRDFKRDETNLNALIGVRYLIR